MKFLFDTDHISILQRQSGTEFLVLSSKIAQHSATDLAFCVVSFHEQVLGCHTYINRARTSSEVQKGYAMLGQVIQCFSVAPVLPFDGAAATVFDELVQRRIRVATMDLRVASIAIANRLILLTRNDRDFSKVPGLQTENWTT